MTEAPPRIADRYRIQEPLARGGQTVICNAMLCAPGYHCEPKGINGGVVPACIKDQP